MKTAIERIQPSRISSQTILGILTFAFVFLLFAANLTPAHAEVILVTDLSYGSQSRGGLFAVDALGFRSMLSDFNDSLQGPLGYDPVGAAVGNDYFWVVDMNAEALFQVDAAGMRTLISDFRNSNQGPLGYRPNAVAVENSGQLLVVDQDTGSPPGLCRYGVLFRVDPANGNRTVLSNFCDAAQGPLGAAPWGVAIEGPDSILVCATAALFRIDPSKLTTGNRILLSDLHDAGQGPIGHTPRDVAVEPSGTILLADSQGGTDDKGAIFRVDKTSGNRIILSDFGDPAQGQVGAPTGMTVTKTGEILVILWTEGETSSLYLVNSTTGNRTIISDFSNLSQGPLGVLPYRVTVGTIPPPPGAPPAPSNLQARLGIGSRGSDVILQWNDNSLNEDFFEVWRSVDGVSFGNAAYATTAASYLVDENVRIRYPVEQPPHYPFRYCYKVRAVNSEGASDFTDPKCPLLPPAKREPLDAVGLPSPPAPRIVLSWTNPDYGDPPTMIKISRSLDPRGPFYTYDEIPFVDAANGFYDDSGVITGQQYCYQMVATNGSSIASQSLPSQACANVPQPLTIYNFRSRVRPHTATFTWDTNVATRGEVSLNGGPLSRVHGVGTHHTITFGNLTDQTIYSFDVVATRIAEPHDSVHELGSFTTPDPSTFMYISNVSLSTTSTSATITWVTSARADGTVEYGTDNAGVCNYTNTLPSGTNVIDHLTTISGLLPENRYCYRLVATRGSDTDEYMGAFETAGMPRLEIQSVSGPFLRYDESGPDADTKPWYMEYKVQIRNHRGRTSIDANQVAVGTNTTTLEVPCDQLREPRICTSSVETVPLSLSPSVPVDIPADGRAEISIRFPVRVPLRGLIGSGANLHLSLGYQYSSGAGTVSTTSDFTTSVPLQRFGLSISLSDSPDPVPLDSLLVYTIKITNNGTCEAADEPCDSPPVSVRLEWDSRIDYIVSHQFRPRESYCDYDWDNHTFTCDIPGLSKGAVNTGRLVLRSPQTPSSMGDMRPLQMSASLRNLSAPDPYPYDHIATEFTTVDTRGSTHMVDVTEWVQGEMTSVNPLSCRDFGSRAEGVHAYYTYCNNGSSSYSNLRGVVEALPEGARLEYWGLSIDFPRVLGYSDGVLDPGDCVDVLYSICPLSDISQMRQARFRVKGLILP